MAGIQASRDVFINETERKPNRYAARVLAGAVLVMIVVWLLNEAGIFTVNHILMRVCLVVSVVQLLLMQLVVRNPKWIVLPSVKYLFMAIVLLLVLTLTVLLNVHAVLAFVLPILLATQYRSHRVSRIALIGSCICCGVAPILSYLLGTWALDFMTGYIQTFCRVTISVTPGNHMSTPEAIRQITLFWSMPQMLTLASFGLILFSVTKSGIDSVDNQMQVVDLSNDLRQQLVSIQSMQEKVLYLMSDIIESRDIETGGHVRRTSEVVRVLMHAIQEDGSSGVSEAFCSAVIKCAPMHDLGKIAVPDTILRKPERLTETEYAIVKQHPIKSAEIIVQALTGIEDEQLLTIATNIAKYHHERFDGMGYPDGLKGKQIPLEARIMAIADVYDALVSERCYKAPMAFGEAFDTIECSMGAQFDPDLNRYFTDCRPQIEAFYTKTNEEAAS